MNAQALQMVTLTLFSRSPSTTEKDGFVGTAHDSDQKSFSFSSEAPKDWYTFPLGTVFEAEASVGRYIKNITRVISQPVSAPAP